MLYLVAIAAFAVFNRWVLRSTVELEKSRANYSRYFSPDVRDEIESSTNNANEKSSRDLTVAVMFTDISEYIIVLSYVEGKSQKKRD